jgi:uncharacterized protein
MNRVVHFEIPVDDTLRAVKFYKAVFGWEITDTGRGEYYLLTTGGDNEVGINGGLYKREVPLQGETPENSFVSIIQVENLDQYIQRVKDNGGTIAMVGDQEKTEEMQGVGTFTTCKDTEGNLFRLLQPLS